MLIEIRNWEKYNPRSDVKSTHWLRLQNDILIELFDLTSDQKLTWIALLCEASRKQTGRIDISPGLIAAILKATEESVRQAIDAFVEKGFISRPVHARNVDVTPTSLARDADVTDPIVIDPLRDGTGRNEETSSLVDSAPTPLDLVQVWHEAKAACQPAVRLPLMKPGSKRWRHAQARLKDHPDLAAWRELVGKLAVSPWHTGQNDRGWVADFDFLVKPDTFVRGAEGAFDRRLTNGAHPKQEIPVITEVTKEWLYGE